MNPYYNLPPEQRRVQQLVAQLNAEAQQWRSLEAERLLRRWRTQSYRPSFENNSTCSNSQGRVYYKTLSVDLCNNGTRSDNRPQIATGSQSVLRDVIFGE